MKHHGNNKTRIAFAQINCTVGDLEGNSGKIRQFIKKATENYADIIIFPELAITGYPPEDLLYKPYFIEDNLKKLEQIKNIVEDFIAIVGFVHREGPDLYNAAALIYKQEIRGIYHKTLLPNYGVFDEKRYFKPGKNPLIFRLNGCICGVTICEDIWYEDGPVKGMVLQGTNLVLNINASPYHAGKVIEREDIIRKQAKKNNLIIAYINLIGGQDEIVFDGQSMLVNQNGEIVARADAFKEELMFFDIGISQTIKNTNADIIDINIKRAARSNLPVKKNVLLEPIQEIYNALMLGLKDYVDKNGFKKVVIALSGGIDSSLVAVIARDALGEKNVTGIFMPTRYSSSESVAAVKELAHNLGINLLNISIEQIYKIYLIILEQYFAGMPRDITEENLQARIRATTIMAFSNKFGWLVLSTGNKSEMSTGYATLYGDMAGGLAVIKDVPKTLVYKLAEYRNKLGKLIPPSVLTREPTAELKNNQQDRDTLPVYEKLDPILKAYIEENKNLNQITALGFPREMAENVIKMVDKNEHKRRQSPPGIKITPRAFGKDRRMPITNKYKK